MVSVAVAEPVSVDLPDTRLTASPLQHQLDSAPRKVPLLAQLHVRIGGVRIVCTEQ
jgi:hypothetical protein